MHSTETVNQFLTLRAQGWSFDRIADHLHVSKPTLLDWGRKHQPRLEAIRSAHDRSLRESLQVARDQELEQLTAFRNTLRQELVSRSLRTIPTDQIEALVVNIDQQIEKLGGKEISDASNGN